MSVWRYAEGWVLIAVAFVPIGMAGHAWRRRLLPEWTGPPAHLAVIVISIAFTICASELLGLIDLFRLAAIVPVFAGLGLAGWYFANRNLEVSVRTTSAETDAPPSVGRTPLAATLAALLGVSVVAASWGTRTVDALHHGMTSTDTLWYHMPFAARFVQQGTIVPLHYVDSEAVTVFFPATSELVHALGIAFLGSDFLSPLINVGWAALALLAGWCIGRPYGVAATSLTGAAALLVTPGLIATQPGGGYDDVVGLALLLSCAALLITTVDIGATRWAGQNVAALAAGVALGTKFTFIAPVAALTVGIWVLAGRGRRLRESGVWLLLVAATGSFWYFRNLIIVGNPLPSLHLHLGSLSLPSPSVGTATSTVAHFLFQGSAWRHYLLPGLRMSFGPAWWGLLGLALAGLLLAAALGPSRVTRMLGWVGLAAGAAFLVTPQYLAILGAPVYFVDNVRYGDSAIVFGLALLPVVPLARRGRALWLILGAYLAILLVTQLDGTIWPFDVLSERFGVAVGGTDSLLGLLCGVLVLAFGLLIVGLRHSRPRWRPHVGAALGIGLAVLVSGAALQQFYLRHRYSDPNLVTIAGNLTNSRIAVAGGFGQIQYEFYGRDLSNYVQFIGQPEAHHGYATVSSCESWRQLINEGHYDYVLTTTGFVKDRQDIIAHPPDIAVWTGTDAASTLVRRQIFTLAPLNNVFIGYSLFKLHGPLDPATCPTSGTRSQ